LSVSSAVHLESGTLEQLQNGRKCVAFALVTEFVGVDFARWDRNGENKFSARAKNSREVAERARVVFEMFEDFEEQNCVERRIADGELIGSHYQRR